MRSAVVFTSLVLALTATASPISEREIEKRSANCFAYNKEGCKFGSTGRQGAVATVRYPSIDLVAEMSRADLTKFRKSGPALKSELTFSSKAVMPLTVSILRQGGPI